MVVNLDSGLDLIVGRHSAVLILLKSARSREVTEDEGADENAGDHGGAITYVVSHDGEHPVID
jgi:hypothetical protein